jgi:hypothetical protein
MTGEIEQPKATLGSLPKEFWAIVLANLQPAVPGIKDNVKRYAEQQADLARTLRVCKVCHWCHCDRRTSKWSTTLLAEADVEGLA